jgi:hypothetical protein
MDRVLFRVALRFYRQAQGRLTNRGFGPIIEVKVMETTTLIQILITLAVVWYSGMAIIENSKNKKPMATRRKK